VPTAALAIPLPLAASPGVVPVCWYANCLHTASSTWNCSKDFPLPGRTITLGPVGTVAQAPSNGTIISSPIQRLDMSRVLGSPSARRLRGLRRDLLPAARALLDRGVVALRALAVVPVILRLGVLLDVRLR
jgi:hypothetical protein